MTASEVNQSDLDTVGVVRYGRADVVRALDVKAWAHNMFRTRYRQVRDGWIVRSFSRPDVRHLITPNIVSGEYACSCEARVDCQHLLILRMLNIQPNQDIHEAPYKLGQIELLKWMYDHCPDIPNAMTTRAMMDVMLQEGEPHKIQTLRARMSELNTKFSVRYIDTLELLENWPKSGPHYYLTRRGRAWVEQYNGTGARR